MICNLENFVFSELVKSGFNAGLPLNYYFLRDSKGIEVDCVSEKVNNVNLLEIKMSATLSQSHFNNLKSVKQLFPKTTDYVIYSGKQEPIYQQVQFFNWKNIDKYN